MLSSRRTPVTEDQDLVLHRLYNCVNRECLVAGLLLSDLL
jgi:hypothetical protein